jgi:hypothetical protein
MASAFAAISESVSTSKLCGLLFVNAGGRTALSFVRLRQNAEWRAVPAAFARMP